MAGTGTRLVMDGDDKTIMVTRYSGYCNSITPSTNCLRSTQPGTVKLHAACMQLLCMKTRTLLNIYRV